MRTIGSKLTAGKTGLPTQYLLVLAISLREKKIVTNGREAGRTGNGRKRAGWPRLLISLA
jgi:hypothetical protein